MAINELKRSDGTRCFEVTRMKRNFAGSGKIRRFKHRYDDETLAKIMDLKVKAAMDSGDESVLRLLEVGVDDTGTPKHEDPAQKMTWAKACDIAEHDVWSKLSEGYLNTALINAKQITKFFGADCSPFDMNHDMLRSFEQHCKDKGNANTTINRKFATLRTILECAGVSHEFMEKVKNYKEREGRIWTYTPEEKVTILETLKHLGKEDIYDFVELSFELGNRLSELIIAEFSDCDYDAISLWGEGTKSGKSRSIPLSERASTIISRRRKQAEEGQVRLFPTVTKDAFHHHWDVMREVIGVKGDPKYVHHTIRHTVCTRLIMGEFDWQKQKPMPLPAVQKWMGHKSIQTTMKYVHVNAGHLKQFMG